MKKTLNVVYWIILFAALIFVLATAGNRVQAQTISNPALTYESTWTFINANQRLTTIQHDLGALPSTLEVWIASPVRGESDFSVAVPYESYVDGCLKVHVANSTSITLYNGCDAPLMVRVDATLFQP